MKSKIAAAALALSLSAPSMAAYVINVTEVGGNVQASGSGSINTTGLTLTNSGSHPLVRGADALLYIGGIANGVMVPADLIQGSSIAGSATFGTSSSNIDADAASGDFVGIVGSTHRLLVPLGYVSQAPLTSSATWNGATFASLGLTPGTYEWTWGTGPDADKLTVNIGATAPVANASIPTLSEWGLIGLSSLLAMLGFSRMRRGKFQSS